MQTGVTLVVALLVGILIALLVFYCLRITALSATALGLLTMGFIMTFWFNPECAANGSELMIMLYVMVGIIILLCLFIYIIVRGLTDRRATGPVLPVCIPEAKVPLPS